MPLHGFHVVSPAITNSGWDVVNKRFHLDKEPDLLHKKIYLFSPQFVE